MICPVCKTENDADAKFCKNCGTALTIEEPEKEPEEAPEMSILDYNQVKPDRSLKSWLVSLFFPGIVLLILLFSYLYVLVSE